MEQATPLGLMHPTPKADPRDIDARLEESSEARQSRARVYERIESIRLMQVSTDHRVAAIESAQQNRILPAIQRMEVAEGQGKALYWAGGHAWQTLRWIAGLAAAGIVMFWRELLDLIRGG